MNNSKISTLVNVQDPEFMERLYNANIVTFNECVNGINNNKAIINFELSAYTFQHNDLFEPVHLSAALIDLHAFATILINKLNDLEL